jgi:hypothetical protein
MTCLDNGLYAWQSSVGTSSSKRKCPPVLSKSFRGKARDTFVLGKEGRDSKFPITVKVSAARLKLDPRTPIKIMVVGQ